MDELSSRAVSIDENDARAWWIRAETLLRQGRWDAALQANAKAEELDPGFGGLRTQRAAIGIQKGSPEQALVLISEYLALQPQESSEIGEAMLQRCRASMALGRYDDVIAACERAIALSDWWLPHLYLAAAYALKGDARRAAAEKAILTELRSGVSFADYMALWRSDSAVYAQQTETHLLTGLRRANVPER
jgi:tetratricopeptide (TPR) repeat protein